MVRRLSAYLTRDRVGRFVRFGLVGGTATLAYAVIAFVLITYAGIDDVVASVLAYAAAIPVSFFGQKFFAFRSAGPMAEEALRFFVVQGANLILAAGIMALVTDVLGFGAIVGIVAVTVTIPVFTYICLSIIVFSGRA